MCFVHSLRSVDVFYVFMERSKCVVLNLLGAVDSGDQVFDVRQSFEWNTLLYRRHFFSCLLHRMQVYVCGVMHSMTTV